jgi:putative ABC transport system permease protein
VQTVTARLGFSALISTGDKTMNCLATGVMADREQQLSNAETILEGKKLGANDGSGVILGYLLSRALGVEVGDTVTLLTTTAAGMINAQDLQVTGIARVGSREYDRVFVKLPLAVAQQLLNTKEVERVVILLDRTSDTARVAQALKSRFQTVGLPLEIKTWEELADFYQAVVRLYNGIFRVVVLIIASLFLFGIANTLTMSIFERVREIGTLRAIGTRREGIRMMFLWEGFVLGLIGGVLGVLVGVATAGLINVAGGFYIPPPPGMSDGYQAYISLDWGVVLESFLLTVVAATVSSLYPALRAARLNIVQALTHT